MSLNNRGESDDKGYAEIADTKAFEVILYPLEAINLKKSPFSTYIEHKKEGGENERKIYSI